MDRIKTISISGIEILVEKKKIKNLYIRIFPPGGNVRAAVPDTISDEDINNFLLARMDWIQKKRDEISRKEYQPEKYYETGETHYLWGKKYMLQVLYSDGESEVWKQDNTIYLKVKKNCDAEYRKHIMDRWYRDILAVQIKNVLPGCVETVGKKPLEWHIKDMHTRWGTCNVAKKRIWLNLQLVKQPPECLAYVITHELVHLYERNHNAVFKAYMDRFYPDWRQVKEMLRIDL